VKVSDDKNEQKCFFDERYRRYYKEIIDRRSAVTLDCTSIVFHVWSGRETSALAEPSTTVHPSSSVHS